MSTVAVSSNYPANQRVADRTRRELHQSDPEGPRGSCRPVRELRSCQRALQMPFQEAGARTRQVAPLQIGADLPGRMAACRQS
eukprot:6182348-Pleurochrysis_carterae.AAC.3